MRVMLSLTLLFLLGTRSVSASEDPPDGISPPVLLTSTELPLPKALEHARFRVKLLYGVHIKQDGSVGVVDLLACATQDEGESEFSNASKAVCDPIDKEIRDGVSKRKYQPAVKDGKAVTFDSVVKVDLVPSGVARIDRIACFLVAGGYSLAGTAADTAFARAILWAFVDAVIVLVIAGTVCGVGVGRLRWRLARVALITAALGLAPFSPSMFFTLWDALAPTVEPVRHVWMEPKAWVPILPSLVGVLAFTGTLIAVRKRQTHDELQKPTAV